MSVFQLPKTLCSDINSMMSKFWWENKENDSKMAWMSCEKMGRTREKGGLGFRDFEYLNLALLEKQGWRLLHNIKSLVAKIYKEKYYPNSTFLETPLGRSPPFAWRSIWNARKLLKEGLVWRVGDGCSIKIWEDRWVDSPSIYAIQSPVNVLNEGAKVCNLIDTNNNGWNKNLLEELFSEEEARKIREMAICPSYQPDQLMWVGSKNGDYSVRSAYHWLKGRRELEDGCCSSNNSLGNLWRDIWNLWVPRAVALFLWKACTNILPTKENLY